jgi:hypothetical protein
MALRNAPLYVTLTTICTVLVFGVHCGNGNSNEGSGFSQTALYCQAAAAQLQSCCPDYDPGAISCDLRSYVVTTGSTDTSSCTGETSMSTSTTNYPTLTQSESTCILNQDCTTLVTTGVCDRAAKAAGSGPSTVKQVTEDPPAGCSGGGSEATYYEDAYVEGDGSIPAPVDAGAVCP